jgi:hypothetical protein
MPVKILQLSELGEEVVATCVAGQFYKRLCVERFIISLSGRFDGYAIEIEPACALRR